MIHPTSRLAFGLLLISALGLAGPSPANAARGARPPAPAAAPAATEPAAPAAEPAAAGQTEAAPQTQQPVDEEAARLAEALRREVPKVITDKPESAQAWIERAQAAIAAGGYRIERPQLLVVVDRNPRVQQMRILLARPDAPWQSLGGVKVSTGQPRGFEHFLTPTGVFPHTQRILDWRAEGTFNENGVRGLGVQGMRVWDFGWQTALKGWGPPGGIGKMRLLMHATDPTNLERRIGRPASDGCVRIPTEMNRFLDAHGVLDSDYERVARRNVRFASVLLPDRTPSPLAGDALIIIDSAENPAMQGSTTPPPQEAPAQTSAPAQPAAPKVGKRTAVHAHRPGPHRHRHRA